MSKEKFETYKAARKRGHNWSRRPRQDDADGGDDKVCAEVMGW